MAHFATLDGSNVVTAVNVIADADCLDSESNESEAVGIAFCVSLFGAGTYKQTSYNNNIRTRYAHVGGTYDPVRNEFVFASPDVSWVKLANNTWQSPLGAMPVKSGFFYEWNEANYQADNSTGWTEIAVLVR
mgnify:CR=1 FL=1